MTSEKRSIKAFYKKNILLRGLKKEWDNCDRDKNIDTALSLFWTHLENKNIALKSLRCIFSIKLEIKVAKKFLYSLIPTEP